MTYQSKGYAVAALVEVLKKRGLLERVAERVSPSTRALLMHPPPATSWADGKKVSEMYVAVDAIVGEAEVRKIGHEVTNRGAVVLLRPVVEGFLRLFGGTPATIFSRMALIIASSSRGYECGYEPTGEREGMVFLRFPDDPDVPRPMFMMFAGSMMAVFDLCGVRGVSQDPDITRDHRSSLGRVRVSW